MRTEIIKLTYEGINDSKDDMFYASVVWRGIFGLENTYAFFSERIDAEKWFSEKTKNKTNYYGYCCDNNFWKNTKELLGE